MHRGARRAIYAASRTHDLALWQRSRNKQHGFASLAWDERFNEQAVVSSRGVAQERDDKGKQRVKDKVAPLNSGFFDGNRLGLARTAHQQEHRKQQTPNVVQEYRDAVRSGNHRRVWTTYKQMRNAIVAVQQKDAACSSHMATALSSITRQDLRSAMRIGLGITELDESPTNVHVRLTTSIFADLTDVFGFLPEAVDCRYSLLASSLLQSRKDWRRVRDHLLDLKQRFPQWDVDARDWLIVAEAANDCKDVRGVHDTFKTALHGPMHDLIEPLRDFVVSALLRAGHTTEALEMVSISKSRGGFLPYEKENTNSIVTLLKGLCHAGLALSFEGSEEIAAILKERLAALKTLDDRTAWHVLHSYTALASGGGAAVTMAQEAIRDGVFMPNKETFNILLKGHWRELKRISYDGTAEDILRLMRTIRQAIDISPDQESCALGIETLLGCEIGPSHESREQAWPIRLQEVCNAVEEYLPQYSPGQMHEASALFRSFVERGQECTPKMALSLLTAHAASFIPTVDPALRINNALRTSAKSRSHAKTIEDTKICNAMLAIAIRARDPQVTKHILQDAADDGCVLSHDARTDIVLAVMRAKFPLQHIFEVYEIVRDRLARPAGEKPFARSDWSAIMYEAGCLQANDHTDDAKSHSTAVQDVAQDNPVDMMLAIVGDAQRHGLGPDMAFYTTQLRGWSTAYTKQRARGAPQSVLWRFCRGVIGLHLLLQRSQDIEPDLAIITTLMNAYNHVQMPHYSLELWQRLVMGDVQIDGATLAVILDTCGHAGLAQDARRAWRWARRSERQLSATADPGTAMAGEPSWPINKDAWDAYLECLARCGALREAITLATTEMQHDLIKNRARVVQKPSSHQMHDLGAQPIKEKALGPDAKTFAMLLSFAAPDGLSLDATSTTYNEFRNTIKSDFPHVWPHVKHIRPNSSPKNILD